MRAGSLLAGLALLLLGCSKSQPRTGVAFDGKGPEVAEPYTPHPSSEIAKRGGEHFTILVVQQMISAAWWKDRRIPRQEVISPNIREFVEKAEMRPMLETYKWSATMSADATVVVIEEWRDGSIFQSITKKLPPGDPRVYWDAQYDVDLETGAQVLIKDPLNISHSLAFELYLLYERGEMPATFTELISRDARAYEELEASGAERYKFRWAAPTTLWIELPDGKRRVEYPLSGRFEPADAEFPVKVRVNEQ